MYTLAAPLVRTNYQIPFSVRASCDQEVPELARAESLTESKLVVKLAVLQRALPRGFQ